MSVLYKIREVKRIDDISRVNELLKNGWMLIEIVSAKEKIEFIIGC